MNTNQLFEAIGEVDAEKLRHSEQSPRRHRPLRFVGVLAAVIASLAALTLIVNASTDGAMLNVLRIWLNGESIQTNDPRVQQSTDANGNDILQIDVDSKDYELIAAKTDESKESLVIQRYLSNEDSQMLGFVMQVNQVEERDGKIVLSYGGDEIDLTEKLHNSDECTVDYSVYWDNKLASHILIRVQKTANGQYYVFTEPAK